MSDLPDAHRRMLLTALAGVALSSSVLPHAEARTSNGQSNSTTLVAYFSRSGNTRVIAGVIHRHLSTDLFEIEPATAYPEDYFATVEQAKSQSDQNFKPALKNSVENFEGYQTVYLGFPIWGMTVPPIVQTFLSRGDWNNKLIIPFITHGGYGVGNSDEVLSTLAATAKREKPLVIECDQERKTTETVAHWLTAIRS